MAGGTGIDIAFDPGGRDGNPAIGDNGGSGEGIQNSNLPHCANSPPPCSDAINDATFDVASVSPAGAVRLGAKVGSVKALAILASVMKGKAGEAAVKATVNIGSKRLIFVNGRFRVPDGINLRAKTLSEVINVATLTDGRSIRQIGDYADYAYERGLAFNLYVRPGAQVGQAVRDLAANGRVNILDIPF